jgi:hypothetical protein
MDFDMDKKSPMGLKRPGTPWRGLSPVPRSGFSLAPEFTDRAGIILPFHSFIRRPILHGNAPG